MGALSIAKSLELTLLRPDVTLADVRSACELAAAHHLAAVSVRPVHVSAAAGLLNSHDTRVIAAIGFPHGQDVVETKLMAVERARADGADELAIMLDASLMVSNDVDGARRELERLLASAFWTSLVTTRGAGHLTIVVETMALDLERFKPLWETLHDSPASFLQTSGGLHTRAVTADHVRTLRAIVPSDVHLKAVGGVGTFEDALGLVNAGAVRVGSASAVAIAEQERHQRTLRQGA